MLDICDFTLYIIKSISTVYIERPAHIYAIIKKQSIEDKWVDLNTLKTCTGHILSQMKRKKSILGPLRFFSLFCIVTLAKAHLPHKFILSSNWQP